MCATEHFYLLNIETGAEWIRTVLKKPGSADYVISGHMAASAWVRAAKVTGVLFTVVAILIVTLERFRVLEKIDARRRDRRAKREGAVEKVD